MAMTQQPLEPNHNWLLQNETSATAQEPTKLEFCFYPLPNYLGMAAFFLVQAAVIVASIVKSTSVRQLITQRNSLQPILLVYLATFMLKSMFFLVVGTYISAIGDRHDPTRAMVWTRQCVYLMDIILSCVYFNFLYKMRFVQIQMNEKGKQPSEVFKRVIYA